MAKKDSLYKIYQVWDEKILTFMRKHGEPIEKSLLGIYFLWFGTLKIIGEKSASSIIAKSVYWFDPSWLVPTLGLWEVVIGFSVMVTVLHRLAIFLLFVRIPGIILALGIHWHECFNNSFLTPTIQGQYLIKELTLVGAALVIGSTIKKEEIEVV